ncbi:MAG: E3 ubiquitin--protein ligase [Gammaproteobacteria bacterium]|nr:E3 ubiquitin--protein ligase [Gammaproteobacteria bacterium]
MDAESLLLRFPEFVAEVRGLSPEGFWFILALLVVATSAAFYFIWRSLHRARLIEDTPTARIRSAHQGYLELEGDGRLLDGPPIVGPLTGTHCLWYRYQIEHRESHRDSRGHSHSSWRTIQSGVSDGLFLIEDETGRCIVDPDGAEVIVEEKDVWYGYAGFPRGGPPVTKSWFRLSGGDYRYTEERLMPGPVYALGWFNTVRNAASDMSADVSAVLREWKADQTGVLARFDRNGDGKLDTNEWDAARAAALQEVMKLRSQRPALPFSNLLSRSTSDRQPFLLSAIPQQVLTARYRRHALIALVLTFVGVVATVLYVTARFDFPG